MSFFFTNLFVFVFCLKAPLPQKPQAVLIERWLPYTEVKRRVVFNRPTEPDPVVVKPRNVIVQWDAPQVYILYLLNSIKLMCQFMC